MSNWITFKEKEFGNTFQARPITARECDWWGFYSGATHVINPGQEHKERFAEIKATVAYVFIDEDQYGRPIKETWKIRKLA